MLEAAWKAAPAAERDLWQGLAQVCVGITHAQRGNATGAARLLDPGIDRLRRYSSNPPHPIDVAGLLDWHAQHGTNPTATDPLVCSPSGRTGLRRNLPTRHGPIRPPRAS